MVVVDAAGVDVVDVVVVVVELVVVVVVELVVVVVVVVPARVVDVEPARVVGVALVVVVVVPRGAVVGVGTVVDGDGRGTAAVGVTGTPVVPAREAGAMARYHPPSPAKATVMSTVDQRTPTRVETGRPNRTRNVRRRAAASAGTAGVEPLVGPMAPWAMWSPSAGAIRGNHPGWPGLPAS